MIKARFFFIYFLAASAVTAQPCSCYDTYLWLKETFETNDAGFAYAIGQKGETAYQQHCDKYAEQSKSITAKPPCAQLLSGWLQFFRNGHLSFGLNPDKEQPGNSSKPGPDLIRKLYADWEKFNLDDQAFYDYIFALQNPGLEGIWTTGIYTIGVKKAGNTLVGFILQGDGVYWSRAQVKFRISEQDNRYSAVYYMLDHSAKTITDVRLLGNNYLQLGKVILKRSSPEFPADTALDFQLQWLQSARPVFHQLNAHTAMLRIPSFDPSAKKDIDSVIAANWQTLTSTTNLVIDLRNNGGGSDGSFEKLLPLLCTNPIRTVGVEYLSTLLNNTRMDEFLTNPDFDEETRNWARESLEKLNQNLGKFVNLDSADVTIDTPDTIYPYPKNVGIIIHENNGSTTEQFLLAAKQSKKVKLFGTTTAGVLDISNMHFVNSPCDDYQLGYSLTRSKRIPNFTIDGKGIQPDYYIDPSIPAHEWIDFVDDVLNTL